MTLRSLCESAHRIADAAPAEAQIYLDTVKRILEIDTQVTDPTIVLMRASLFETEGAAMTLTHKRCQRVDAPGYQDARAGRHHRRSALALLLG